MSSAVQARDIEQTDVPFVVRNAIKLGLLEAVLVLLFSLVSRYLGGIVETVLATLILVVGVAAVVALPGLWTRARTIDGIATAAGIGLAAGFVFLVVDVSLLQPIGTYTNRWRDIGGGSDWWYHPVWWMVGTYMPWMGAYTLAHQADRGGVSAPKLLVSVLVATIVFGALAVVLHLPHAAWDLGTFAVAVLPALAAVCLISGVGRPRP